MTVNKIFTVSLVVGDWSGDGHSQTETYSVNCNLNNKKLAEAYKKGCARLGFDFTEDCRDYESSITFDSWSKICAAIGTEKVLKALDFYTDEDFTPDSYLQEKNMGEWDFGPDQYVELWMLVAKHGNPTLDYKIVTENARINIGGYGLFSC